MSLIVCDRHTPRDLAHWAREEEHDRRIADSPELARHEDRALAIIREYTASPCYIGTSWGKDSVVLAHLARRVDPSLPLVWVRCLPRESPHCALVRDAFLARFPGAYDEIEIVSEPDGKGGWKRGSLVRGGRIAGERYGDRYISGVRAEESSQRETRMRVYGATTAHTCAPLGWWRAIHIFAYLAKYDLPIHPAYAMSFGASLDRTRIRVAPLDASLDRSGKGSGHGRTEWEERYYAPEVAALRAQLQASLA